MELVHIIVPTHFRSSAVADLLRSLEEQSLEPAQFAILIVTNFPDARLKRVLDRWRKPGRARAELACVGALGVNRARNLGLSLSHAPIVLMLDDDCLLTHPDYLKQLVVLHERHPKVTALGGAYLSPGRMNSVGRHYNWICNQWLEAAPGASRPTEILIGGAVSYKTARLAGRVFDESITYGGAETEFHERLLAAGDAFRFEYSLSVLHACKISKIKLIYKAYRQGMAKNLRPRTTPKSYARVPADATVWFALLRGSLCGHLYRSAFALGEIRALDALPPQILPVVCLRVLWSGPKQYLWRWLTRIYWQGVQSYHNTDDLYWKLTEVYWSVYRFKRECGGRFQRFRGRAKARLIDVYWTIYPVLNHVRHNKLGSVRALFNVKMPLTYPTLETEGPAHWAFRGQSLSPLGTDFCAPSPIVLNFPADPGMVLNGEMWAGISLAQINQDGPRALNWLRSLHAPRSLLLRLDASPNTRALESFFRELATLRTLRTCYYQHAISPNDLSAAGAFEAFRWFHGFARVAGMFPRRWRAYYEYVDALEESGAVRVSAALDGAERDVPLKISLIIPHHEDEKNLRRTLECLRRQTLAVTEFEVLVVDNGTRLLPGRVRTELTGGLENLRWLSLESTREDLFLAGPARNLGLKHARGEVVQFLDSDILLPPSYLSDLLETMRGADVVMAKRLMLNASASHDTLPELVVTGLDTYAEDPYWENFKRAEVWTNLPDYWKYACTYCLAVKRESLKVSGPFDPQFSTYGFEDVDLAFRLYKTNAKFSFAKCAVFHLFPSRKVHNYHLDHAGRTRALRRSALRFFLLRPEREPFILCQGYFAPTFLQWILRPLLRRKFGRLPGPEVEAIRPRVAHAE